MAATTRLIRATSLPYGFAGISTVSAGPNHAASPATPRRKATRSVEKAPFWSHIRIYSNRGPRVVKSSRRVARPEQLHDHSVANGLRARSRQRQIQATAPSRAVRGSTVLILHHLWKLPSQRICDTIPSDVFSNRPTIPYKTRATSRAVICRGRFSQWPRHGGSSTAAKSSVQYRRRSCAGRRLTPPRELIQSLCVVLPFGDNGGTRDFILPCVNGCWGCIWKINTLSESRVRSPAL